LVTVTILGPTLLIEVGLLLYVGLLGFILANTTAMALDSQGARAGLASGVLGASQFAMSALGSALVGQIPTSHAVALGLVLVVAAVSTSFWMAAGARRIG
jgi:DHA1 family bicyclomycin/chloramphenicol resistance-like MFS transporter